MPRRALLIAIVLATLFVAAEAGAAQARTAEEAAGRPGAAPAAAAARGAAATAGGPAAGATRRAEGPAARTLGPQGHHHAGRLLEPPVEHAHPGRAHPSR